MKFSLSFGPGLDCTSSKENMINIWTKIAEEYTGDKVNKIIIYSPKKS